MEIREMMPETCATLMDTLNESEKNKTIEMYTEAQKNALDVGHLSMFCPSKSALVLCLSENIFVMRKSSDPIKWGLSIMFDAKHVIHKALMTCRMYEGIQDAAQFQCLEMTKQKRQKCKTKLLDNLVYLRENMDEIGPTMLKEHTVCSAFFDFVACQDVAIKGVCSSRIMHLLAFSNTMFAETDCKNPDKAMQIHQLVLSHSAVAKCGLRDMIFYWTGQNDVDFPKLYSGVSQSCGRLDTIHNCLVSRFSVPQTHIDKMAREAVNVETITKALDVMCHSASKIPAQNKCLKEVNTYGSFCIMFVKGTFMAEVVIAGHDKLHCSHFRDLISCLSTQLKRCDPDIARDFKNAYMMEIKDVDKCRDEKFPSTQLAGSTLVQCGAALAAKSLVAKNKLHTLSVAEQLGTKLNVKIEQQSKTEIIGSVIDFACDEIPWYLECISAMLPLPENKLDRFIKSVVRLDDNKILSSVTRTLCEHKAHIKRNLHCLMDKRLDFNMCIAEYLMTVMRDMQNLTMVEQDSSKVKELCDQIHHITNCAVLVIQSCDQSLGQLVHDVQHQIVRNEGCGHRHVPDGSAAGRPCVNNILVFISLFIFIYQRYSRDT